MDKITRENYKPLYDTYLNGGSHMNLKKGDVFGIVVGAVLTALINIGMGMVNQSSENEFIETRCREIIREEMNTDNSNE